MDLAGAVAHIPFREQERARANLAKVAERLPAVAAEALPSLLADSPDPDTALNFLERLCTPENAEMVRLFGRAGTLLHYAIAVFGYSPWLGETLLQNPDLLHALAREKNLDRSHSREDFREAYARFSSRSFETDVSLLLARFKRREYVRILLRDVLGIATLAEVTAEISALSDVLIEEALRHADMQLRNRYGPPQVLDALGRVLEAPFAVLSLGKLGGIELNYSSDIDLLFLYGDGEQPAAAELGERISNREYFIRLSQQVTEVLSRVTPEGSVFRIDLRLRPQGREGEPAVGLAHALRYYAETAHDWERQALIKVRHSAGSVVLAREFVRGVQPHVYRAEVNFEAVETALNTREKIGAHRRRHKLKIDAGLDVKLDRGGIRDIEFLVQCLQRVYGGAEPWLRSGGTLFSLQKLHDKGHISGKDFHQLNLAYAFLRKVEHRLQIRHGQQTHRLPAQRAELDVLDRSVGREEPQRAELLGEMLRRHMEAVAEIYQRILHAQQRHGQEREAGEFYLSPTGDGGREQSYAQVLERFALDSPEVYEIVSRRDVTARTRRNLHRFLSAAFTSSDRYAAVVRAPQAIERALRIFAVSDHLTDILVRHPELIATVAEIDETPRGAGKLFSASVGLSGPVERDPVFEYLASASVSHSEKLALLRQHHRHRAFASGVRDVLELRPVYDSLTEMSDAADDAVVAAFSIAASPKGFAVLALGRLGTWEFDLASDADLLFVRDEAASEVEARKAAESMMEALAAYTRDGTVFAVDARLRPRGAEGELVSTPAGLADYFAEEAQAWEALTYTKLRYIAGDEELAQRAAEAVRRESRRFAQDAGFAEEVRAMRTKLEQSDAEPNFKVGAGGIYDLDFLAGFLLVKHGVEAEGNLRERLHVLAEHKLLNDGDCATLDNAAELFRTTEHVVRLVTGRARKSLPATEHGREVTDSLTAKILGWEHRGGLAEELERTYGVVRGLFQKVVA